MAEIQLRPFTEDIMTLNLSHRKATLNDLKTIVTLLFEDTLGQTRENLETELDNCYIEAFHKIDRDPNHYLMVVLQDEKIVGCCHLTMLPSLTFTGSTRLQIEAVRVSKKHRDQKIGEWMMCAATAYGQSQGASIIQLSTHKERKRARQFYENLGFEPSHIGMKMHLGQDK